MILFIMICCCLVLGSFIVVSNCGYKNWLWKRFIKVVVMGVIFFLISFLFLMVVCSYVVSVVFWVFINVRYCCVKVGLCINFFIIICSILRLIVWYSRLIFVVK